MKNKKWILRNEKTGQEVEISHFGMLYHWEYFLSPGEEDGIRMAVVFGEEVEYGPVDMRCEMSPKMIEKLTDKHDTMPPPGWRWL